METEENKETKEKGSVKADLRQLGWDFRRLADEIRLKVHLGKMDARDAWAKLEPRIADFEQKMEATAEDVGAEFRKTGLILKEELERLKERLNEE